MGTHIEFNKLKARTKNQHGGIMDRLGKLVRDRYGYQIHYFDLEPENPYHESLYSAFLDKKRPTINNQVFIPIQIENSVIGAARLDGQATDEHLSQIEQLVSLVVESAYSSSERIHFLRKQEEQIHVIHPDNNVRRLKPKKIRNTESPNLISLFEKPEVALRHCLIQRDSQEERWKAATNVFESSRRVALVRWQDLDPSDLTTVDSILELGQLCLYIDDVRHLSIKTQILLSESLKRPQSKDSVHIIIGISCPLMDLRYSKDISQQLFRELTHHLTV